MWILWFILWKQIKYDAILKHPGEKRKLSTEAYVNLLQTQLLKFFSVKDKVEIKIQDNIVCMCSMPLINATICIEMTILILLESTAIVKIVKEVMT